MYTLYTWDVYSVYMGCIQCIHGMYTVYTWDVYTVYMGCIHCIHGMYTVYTWDVYTVYIPYYLLTPWCRVLLEKLTGLQLVKIFPAFHGTRRFITALTSVSHLSLSWASPIQSIYPHPTSWRSVLILSTHLSLGLPSGLFPSGFPTKTL